jgi:hypothetical protein
LHTRLPQPKSSVVWTELPDGAVLFSTESEIYYSLNSVGTLVWQHLSGEGMTHDGLCAAVAAQFPDQDPDEVRRDVEELIGDLLKAELLVEQAAE